MGTNSQLSKARPGHPGAIEIEMERSLAAMAQAEEPRCVYLFWSEGPGFRLAWIYLTTTLSSAQAIR
jgi:hypothetical protein